MRGWLAGAAAALCVAGFLVASGVASADPDPRDPTTPGCLRDISIIGVAPTREGTPITAPFTDEFQFLVTSSGCAAAGTVDYSTSAVMADETDFMPLNGTLKFDAGDLSTQEIVVEVSMDGLAELDESFGVALCQPTGLVRVVNGWGDAVILNDDPWIVYDDAGAPTDGSGTSLAAARAGGHCSR